MQKYDFDSFIEYNRKYRVTVQMSVPPIWLQVAKSPKVTDHFDSVEVACTGTYPKGRCLLLVPASFAAIANALICLRYSWQV